MILVVILVLAWLVILGPGLVRRRSERGGVSSISHFHRSLSVLEHSEATPLVLPAYRLRGEDGSASDCRPRYPAVADVPVLTVVGADQLPRPALAFLGHCGGDPEPAAVVPEERWVPEPAPAIAQRPIDPYARQLARKRRRDTLMVLVLVFACTLLIGCIPGARAAWVVTLVAGISLAAYVALLVHLRSLAEEREQKLRYLRPAPGVAAGMVGDMRPDVGGGLPYGTARVAAR